MPGDILRRELAVGVAGTVEELKLSNFVGVTIEIDKPLNEIAEDEQVNLARTLSEMAVAAGLLADPLIIKKGVWGVALSEREVRIDLPDGKFAGSSKFMHYDTSSLFSNPPVAKVFFINLGRTIDDSKS